MGQYDDTVANLINSLMVETHKLGIKLHIPVHNRYSLGIFKTDGYVARYKLPKKTPV